jgi:hypothetical protein
VVWSAFHAYDGLRALKELDAEGILSTYATAVLARDIHGLVTTEQATEPGPLGTAVGLFTGILGGLVSQQEARAGAHPVKEALS